LRISIHQEFIKRGCQAYTVLGNSKNYLDASLYADSAIAVAVQLNMPKLKIQSMLQRANLATKLSDFGYAEQLLHEVKTIKQKTSEWSIQLEIERTAYLLHQAKGEYQNALEHLSRELDFNDSLKNEKVLQQNIDLDKKYAVLKKKQQIDQLQSEKEDQLKEIKQKNLWIGWSIGVAIIVLGLLILFYLTIQRKRSLDRQIIIQLQQEKTIKAATDILQAQEEERLRFARDLHDGLGSLLSGVKLSLSSIQADLFKNAEQKNLFEHSIIQLEYAIQEMRKISRNMMPETIQQYGLQAAVQNLCESLQTSSTPLIRFECLDFDHRLIADQEIVAYRIIQELLQNAIRHSRAKTILVQLTHHEKTIHLVVEDDGIGYDSLNPQTGMGTKNIKSRVEFLNGVMHIQSHPETGTSVHIEFPSTQR
jgi:signal transduction histidine kinase